MVDEEELKRKAKEEIDKASEAELRRMENDEKRLRSWLKDVLATAWDTIKSAIGGFIAAIFG